MLPIDSTSVEALVLEAPRRLIPRRLPLPAVGEGDGLLRVEACGLCGTDHEQFSGALPTPGPYIPGHEVVGVVEALGPAASERWGVRAGQRVAVEVFQSCRVCGACRQGRTNACAVHGIADMIGFVPVHRSPGLWGGYAQWMYLPPDAVLVPVPDSMDPVLATLFNPLGAGLRWAAVLPGTSRDDVVAVLGPGVRGLAAAAAAKEVGAGFVLVTGFGAADEERLALARSFGADLTVDVATDDPVRALRSAAGRLADVVVDVTAKAPAAFDQALQLARSGGTVVCAGTRGAQADGASAAPGFSPDTLVYKELRLLGALGVDTSAYDRALELLASGRYPFAALPRAVTDLSGLPALLTSLSEPSDGAGGSRPVHSVVVPG